MFLELYDQICNSWKKKHEQSRKPTIKNFFLKNFNCFRFELFTTRKAKVIKLKFENTRSMQKHYK